MIWYYKQHFHIRILVKTIPIYKGFERNISERNGHRVGNITGAI